MIRTVTRTALTTAFALSALSALLSAPTAAAQPGCTAAELSNALGIVGGQTGAYLSSHPDANEAISSAGTAPDPPKVIQDYFLAHQDQWAELQRIASPLRTLKAQCQVDVAPSQIAQLYAAMAS
jgi:heme-binding protein